MNKLVLLAINTIFLGVIVFHYTDSKAGLILLILFPIVLLSYHVTKRVRR